MDPPRRAIKAGLGTYRAPWWLPGRHAQTILAPLLRIAVRPEYLSRQRWTTPDGDFIDVDWAGPLNAPRLLVVFHGLEGDSESHYARAFVAEALARGDWRCALPHFRGCSGEANRKARAYHAGDSDEINWILRRFKDEGAAKIYPVGVSLGGNALLKWLGEQGKDATKVVQRAAAVSAPFDLEAFGGNLERGFLSRGYGWAFLYLFGLRCKGLRKIQDFPDECAALGVSAEHVGAATTLPEFDDKMTAPLHLFRDKLDYWKRSSTADLLPKIRVPTLLLNARNDPFLPERVLPKAGELPKNVETDFPDHGGHAGFPGRKQWLARRVLEFLSGPES